MILLLNPSAQQQRSSASFTFHIAMDSNSIATNTLLMPNIPALFFEYPASLAFLRSTFEKYGNLHAFVAMKGFRRLMIIYDETLCSVDAHDSLDKKTLLWTQPSSTSESIYLYIKDAGECVDVPGLDDMQIRIYYGQVSVKLDISYCSLFTMGRIA